MAATRQFKEGDILFREGDLSEHVLRIAIGQVEISRLIGTESVVLGHVAAGEFLGEMAAVENRLHSATARGLGRYGGGHHRSTVSQLRQP